MRKNGVDHGSHHFMPPLFNQRLRFVTDLVESNGVQSVLDVGCSGGQLLHFLIMSCRRENSLRRYVGFDASRDALHRASASLPTSLCPTELLYSCDINFVEGDISLDETRLSRDVLQLLENKFELIACIEVIEHVPKARLGSFLTTIFDSLCTICNAQTVVLTTPNRDYNWLFGSQQQLLRHDDHKFELSHAQFVRLCTIIYRQFSGWTLEFSVVGRGATQCAVFRRDGTVRFSQENCIHIGEFQRKVESIFDDLEDAVVPSLELEEIDAPLRIFRGVATVAAVDVWERLRRATVQYATRLHHERRVDIIVLQINDIIASPELISDLTLTPLALYSAMKNLQKSLSSSSGHEISRCGNYQFTSNANFNCCCTEWILDSQHLVESALGITTIDWLNDTVAIGKTLVFEIAITLANLGYCFHAGSPVTVVSDTSQRRQIVAQSDNA